MGQEKEGIYHVRLVYFCRVPSKLLDTLPHSRFWQLATDALPPQDAAVLSEDLGIELDTPEHVAVERGPLCAIQNSLKRKR